ncbi:hypothetical protein [uncultured Pseudoteredinibacter sp.]|uniref:hypothetical protein n=1 Tax=uncultured Pseudoteredinibacter sp. TaxID=1641701 RepID=UPI002634AA0E|nr:hypothetical protein [uncultured Pseudoteredinibacter sp.]
MFEFGVKSVLSAGSKVTLISASFLFALPAVAKCKYYSYLDYGVDPSVGKVFRSSGVRMYQPGFEAAYSPYGHVKKDGFVVESLGPFNSSSEAKLHLQLALRKLKSEGYKQRSGASFPRVMLLNKKLCAVTG